MKTLRQAIFEAREEYLKYAVTYPKQFNIAKSKSRGWSVEFHEKETCWEEGYITWESDPKVVLDLFFTADEDLVNLFGWDEEWTEE